MCMELHFRYPCTIPITLSHRPNTRKECKLSANSKWIHFLLVLDVQLMVTWDCTCYTCKKQYLQVLGLQAKIGLQVHASAHKFGQTCASAEELSWCISLATLTETSHLRVRSRQGQQAYSSQASHMQAPRDFPDVEPPSFSQKYQSFWLRPPWHRHARVFCVSPSALDLWFDQSPPLNTTRFAESSLFVILTSLQVPCIRNQTTDYLPFAVSLWESNQKRSWKFMFRLILFSVSE